MIDFERFVVTAREGRIPYPWQLKLAKQLAREQQPSAPERTTPETKGPGPAAPLTIAVPTGSGKTTVVDALVWALATQAERLPRDRTIGVRIVWAIDRRLLVDEVHAQATVLADQLTEALAKPTHPLHELAARLQRLKTPVEAGTSNLDAIAGPPLAVTRWRGGVATPDLAKHPMQAEIITSTVAQIGSRLLFRGFGLGERSLPLGAALAACDTTICLDEAHIVEPFRQTAAAVVARQRLGHPATVPPARLIVLSATPRVTPEAEAPITLTNADGVALGLRLTGPKTATLVEPTGASDAAQETALLAAISEHRAQGAMSIACVVNSVRTARRVFDRLEAQTDADRMLLIGPQRPADRTALMNATGRGAGPTHRKVLFDGVVPHRPLIVVATQAFEVGLDASVEALVTQSASASALTQRFGRLNRGGDRHGRATVIRHQDFPLYRDEEPDAWSWLQGLEQTEAGIDVSVAALLRSSPPAPDPVRASRAPELTDATIDLLIQTSPRPHHLADPDVDVFLRGIDADPVSDVTLCWRSDLCPEDESEGADIYRDALLRLAPPTPEEQLSLSISAARNLLRIRLGDLPASAASRTKLVLGGSDVEGDAPPEPQARDNPMAPRFDGIPFFVRRTGEEELLRAPHARSGAGGTITIAQIRPGDLLVLPTTLGCVDSFGLAPESSEGNDVAADLQAAPAADGLSGPVPVRLTREALDGALASVTPMPGPRAQRISRVLRRAAESESRIERAQTANGRRAAIDALLTALDGHPAVALLDARAVELRRLTPPPPPELADPIDDLAGYFLDTEDQRVSVDASPGQLARVPLMSGEDRPMVSDGWVLIPVNRDSGSRRFRTYRDRVRPRGALPPSLTAHTQAVAVRAESFARAAGLSEELVRTVVLAARAHDHGKANPLMQAYYHGGAAPPLAEPIAKSVFGTDDRRADRTARKASGLPVGWRHERSSAAILIHALEHGRVTGLLEAPGGGIDVELVLHLVTSHHGFGRPFPRVPRGGAPPRPFHVDIAGVAGTARGDDQEAWDDGASMRRFACLIARYGAWTLAYLESLLVLADRTVSAEGH